MQVSTWLSYIAFHLWLQTLVGNGCNLFRIMSDIVSKLWAQCSENAVLFDWNLSKRPFLGKVVHLA